MAYTTCTHDEYSVFSLMIASWSPFPGLLELRVRYPLGDFSSLIGLGSNIDTFKVSFTDCLVFIHTPD